MNRWERHCQRHMRKVAALGAIWALLCAGTLVSCLWLKEQPRWHDCCYNQIIWICGWWPT